MAQPGEGQDDLENGRFVRNRLVVVERGGFPIVQKVMGARKGLWQSEASQTTGVPATRIDFVPKSGVGANVEPLWFSPRGLFMCSFTFFAAILCCPPGTKV